MDVSRNLIYLPADHGAIIVAQDGEHTRTALTVSAAIVLARDVLREFYISKTSTIPPISPTLFPLRPGHLDQDFWIAQNGGKTWVGPYPGSATTAVAPASHVEEGYQVQFSLVWMQPDTGKYTRDWVWRVLPSGAVELLRQY